MKNRSILYSRYFTYIKPIAKIPFIKNYGPAIFTLLTISILVIFAIKPTIETILVLQKKMDNSDQVLQKITEKTTNLSLAKQNYDNLEENVKEKISAAIPNNANLKTIIQTLEQTAKQYQASISALQIQPLVIENNTTSGIGTLVEISFVFNTEGSYQNLTAFLQDIKSSDRLISINNLSLTKANEGNTLIMSLSGKAYYLK